MNKYLLSETFSKLQRKLKKSNNQLKFYGNKNHGREKVKFFFCIVLKNFLSNTKLTFPTLANIFGASCYKTANLRWTKCAKSTKTKAYKTSGQIKNRIKSKPTGMLQFSF